MILDDPQFDPKLKDRINIPSDDDDFWESNIIFCYISSFLGILERLKHFEQPIFNPLGLVNKFLSFVNKFLDSLSHFLLFN
jgi:hypothetical protein